MLAVNRRNQVATVKVRPNDLKAKYHIQKRKEMQLNYLDFLESTFRFFVTAVFVRMQFERQLSIFRLNLFNLTEEMYYILI